MCMEMCRCGKFIDTDEEPEAYEVETEDGDTIKLDYALCRSCRDDFDGLLKLKKKAEEFTSEIFDWVRTLGDVAMLDRMYEFQRKIDNLTNPKEQRP